MPRDYKPSDKAETTKARTPQTTLHFEKLNSNPEITNILNSIYKQANEQNENQRNQYEKLTKTLSNSIQAKTNAEQEQINCFNKCIDTIEKTFSA